MQEIRIKNGDNPFTFTENECSCFRCGKIPYESNYMCDVREISLHIESSKVKKIVKQKKWFRTVDVEVEQEIIDRYILLVYARRYNEEKTIRIDVLPNEIKDAELIVEHISSRLESFRKIKEEKQQEKEKKLLDLRLKEEERVKNCIYDVVVIDFETTGLKSPNPLSSSKYDEILSVSIIDQDENILLNSLCKPQNRKTWPTSQEIHGISPAMVKDKPSFEELFPKVKEILFKSKVVIAYNIDFEMQFLLGFDWVFDLPNDDLHVKDLVWGPDPMLMYSAYKGTDRWQKLTAAAKYFKYKFEAHDSLEDVKATLYCYKKLIEYVQQNPEKEFILKYGFCYDKGIKARWLDYSTYKVRPDRDVEL